MVGSIQTVLELDRLDVRVMSVREGWLDTDGPVRSLLVAIFGWVAEQEEVRRKERIHAGIAEARRKGIKLGRPRASPLKLAAAAKLVHEKKISLRRAANEHRIGVETLRRYLQREAGKAA